MSRDKLRDWLEIVGVFSIVASLVFVGFQIKQTQDIAIAAQYQERAKIQLQCESQQVALRVIDEGVGFRVDVDHVPPRGWGLAGMSERAESVEGVFQVYSQPGSGTTVEIVVPISEPDLVELEETTNEHDTINAG